MARYRKIYYPGLNDINYKSFTINSFNTGLMQQKIIDLVRSLDLGIDDIQSKKISDEKIKLHVPNNLPPELYQLIMSDFESEKIQLQTVHKKYDNNGKYISNELFDLRNEESDGTLKLFYLSG